MSKKKLTSKDVGAIVDEIETEESLQNMDIITNYKNTYSLIAKTKK